VLRRLGAFGIVAFGQAALGPHTIEAKGRSKRQRTKPKQQRGHKQNRALESESCANPTSFSCPLPIPPPLPDLSFYSGGSISFDDTLNRWYVAGVAIRNNASGAAGAFQVALRVNGAVVKTYNVSGLAGGGRVALSAYVLSATFSPATVDYDSACGPENRVEGFDRVTMVIDAGKQVKEANETNNSLEIVGFVGC
jgi:hypothetical protein